MRGGTEAVALGHSIQHDSDYARYPLHSCIPFILFAPTPLSVNTHHTRLAASAILAKIDQETYVQLGSERGVLG